MFKLFIDPGHGGNDPGASANGLVEKDLTLAIALALAAFLKKSYQDVTTRLSRETDQTVSLQERTDAANRWRADYYLSIHINAGGGTGFESFIWNGNFLNKKITKQLQTVVHETINEHMSWGDRGKKEANFHVLRETNMPAILTENGFIDTRRDVDQIKSNGWVDDVAKAHGLGIAGAFYLTAKNPPTSATKQSYYRVVAGSFQSKKNAESQSALLKELGFQTFIDRFQK